MCIVVASKNIDKEKTSAARKSGLNETFCLFLTYNNFGVADGISVKFGLWMFHKF